MKAATFPNTHNCAPDSLAVILSRYSAKVLARLSGASYRTTERWRSGQTEPRGTPLIQLMRRNNKLASEILGREVR